jgi:hypothetical protein
MGNWTAKKKEAKEASEPADESAVRQGITRMGTWSGFGANKEADADPARKTAKKTKEEEDDDDRRIRFTIGGAGRRLTKDDFLKEIQQLDPKARAKVIGESDAPADMKEMARKDASDDSPGSSRLFGASGTQIARGRTEARQIGAKMAKVRGAEDVESEGSEGSEEETDARTARKRAAGVAALEGEKPPGISPRPGVGSNRRVSQLDSSSSQEPETPAERRRREDALKGVEEADEEDDYVPETAADRRRNQAAAARNAGSTEDAASPTGETPAERRRREAALGLGGQDSDSDDDNTERVPQPAAAARRGIRFAVEPVRGRKDK